MARGIAEGPALGQVLALAEDAWLAANFPLDQAALDAIADQDRRPLHPRSPAMNIISGFADVSLLQLALVAAMALFASIVGGLAGYGTGPLMPLVLVPLVGAGPVVPIIAISSIFTNLTRAAAYLRYADRRRALIVILAAAFTTVLGAYGYTPAQQCRRGAGDRRDADSERAAAPPGPAPQCQDRDAGARRRRGGLWRGGRRHLGRRRDPAVAFDDGQDWKARRDSHRCRDLVAVSFIKISVFGLAGVGHPRRCWRSRC